MSLIENVGEVFRRHSEEPDLPDLDDLDSKESSVMQIFLSSSTLDLDVVQVATRAGYSITEASETLSCLADKKRLLELAGPPQAKYRIIDRRRRTSKG